VAKISIPCLVFKTNKSGVTTAYWQPSAALKRDGWKSVALGTDIEGAIEAAKAHNRKVDEWRGGGARPAAVRRMVRPLTLPALVKRFKEEGWPSVKERGKFVSAATRKEYGSKFRTLEKWAGDIPLSSIDSDRVAVLRNALMKPAAAGRRQGEVRHNAAHATLRVGRTLFTYAEQNKLIARGSNPFDGFGLAKPDPREQIWWPPAREALLDQADANPDCGGAMMALAIDLAFQIGQREADLLRTAITQYQPLPAYKMDPDVHAALSAMPVPPIGDRPGYIPGDVTGIRLRQSKTKRWVEVPIVGKTRARVEAAIAAAKASGCTTILVDDRRPPDGHWAGKDWRPQPWTAPNPDAGQARFIRRFAEIRSATIAALTKQAADGDTAAAELATEIAELQYRDFRRTAVVHQGELGIPDHLIAAITGHSLDETKKILDTYMPRTTGMAARAIAQMHERTPAPAKEKQG
jgi:hypothetical protein